MMATRSWPRRALAGQALYGALWMFVTVCGAVLKPDIQGHGTHQQLGLPPCPSALVWNRPCPGCGLTTSFSATIHGNLPLGFHAHALGPPIYLAFTLTALLALAKFAKGERFDTTGKFWGWALGGTTVLFLIYGFARMALVDNYRTSVESSISNAADNLARQQRKP